MTAILHKKTNKQTNKQKTNSGHLLTFLRVPFFLLQSLFNLFFMETLTSIFSLVGKIASINGPLLWDTQSFRASSPYKDKQTNNKW